MKTLLFVVTGALIIACAAELAQRSAQADIVVAVDNLNWSDVVLYTVRYGTRSRLGSVTSFTRAYFEVPYSRAPDGRLVILVAPIGGDREYVTEPIMVQPGQTVLLSIHNHLPLSSWTVRKL